jgi:hypothetical protein
MALSPVALELIGLKPDGPQPRILYLSAAGNGPAGAKRIEP